MKEIIDALKRSDEKMESYSTKTDEKMVKCLQKITVTVGTQLQEMNSTIAKMKEKDDRLEQISEKSRIWKSKSLTWTKKYKNRSDEPRGAHGDQNQGKAVITGFHNETSEPGVIQLLKESITEIGMTMENARIECTAKPITDAFIHFKNDDERNKFIRSANILKKELRGRKLKITRSMDAEERFHQKRMGYVKYCIHVKHNIPLDLITMNWTLKAHIGQRPDCGKNMPKRKPQEHQIPRHRNRSRGSNGKLAIKRLIATTVSKSRDGAKTKR